MSRPKSETRPEIISKRAAYRAEKKRRHDLVKNGELPKVSDYHDFDSLSTAMIQVRKEIQQDEIQNERSANEAVEKDIVLLAEAGGGDVEPINIVPTPGSKQGNLF